MQKIRLNELSKDVRAFVNRALESDGVTIQDDNGRACGGVVPFVEATQEERQRAWSRLQTIQEDVARSLHEQGVGEEDVVKLLLEDD